MKADGGVPGVVFQRLSEGETLRDIGRAWGVPVGGFTRWFSEEHCVLYEAALRVRADQLAHEALACADGADAETVAPARLQVDTRLKLAGKWDRERYGERTRVDQTVLVAVDAGLVGIASALLGRMAGGVSAPLEVEDVEVLPLAREKISGGNADDEIPEPI